MVTLTGLRLFRFLLSLVIRLRQSVGHVARAFGARFASLWRSILTFAHRIRGQSQDRLDANDVPMVDKNPIGERPQLLESIKMEDEGNGTLAVPPVWPITRWEDKLSEYQTPTPSHLIEFHALPATTDGSQRYEPRRVRQGESPSDIPAGQQTFLSALPSLPDGWRRHVHPEGNVIFYHEELRIFTESNVIHHEKEILFYATKLIQQAIDTHGVIMDELTEIVLNVDDDRRWHYYFVDHRHRLLFWVHPVKLREGLRTDLQGITGYDHIRYLVEARYWYASSGSSSGTSAPGLFYFGTDPKSSTLCDMESRSHCEYYPHDRIIPKGVLDSLRGMLNYAKTDMMTTDTSSSPFTQDELVAILNLISSLKDNIRIPDPYSIWVIARLMAFFTEDQFMNFCGQPCARLNADTPLFGQQTWNHSIVFKIVNVFLLGSPNEHAIRLRRVWVDGTIIQPRWKDFINRLTNELGRYPIFSTVMLAVNIAFLAVPGVVTAASPASQIQIVIYCSVVSTVGSIVFSFTLSNVYSDPGLMSADTAAKVMKRLSQTKWGMGCLAITHSLPVACLIWSIILFSTALAIQIFSPKERVTVITLGAECLILILFVVVSSYVIRLFSKTNDAYNMDTPAENNPPTGDV